MAYTPPAGNAVTFTWVGASAYTAPVVPLVFSFDPTKFPAIGFITGQFGTPSPLFGAIGFTSTTFGSHTVALVAEGIAPTTEFGLARDERLFTQAPTAVTTQFGPAPYAMFPQTAELVGFGPTAIVPTPVGQQVWEAAGIAPTTRIPTPSRLFNQEATAMSEPSTVFGIPAAEVGAGSASDVFAYAETESALSVFGTPSVGSRTAQAAGAVATQFGLGQVSLLQGVAALSATSQLGTPKARETQDASGVLETAFGTPIVLRSGIAAGFVTGNFGVPASRRVISASVTGFVSGAFGAASAAARSGSATAIPPGVLFGTAQATRSLVC